jgi:hypothetical protein
MDETARSSLAAWESFYVIVGSSAGALTGLQFVVMALIAESGVPRSSREVAAFGTPTIVHFCAALLIAAILSAPWPALTFAGIAVGACGAAGVVYICVVIRRARRTSNYRPVMEDWVWHTILPLLAYGALLVAGVLFAGHPSAALFVVALASLVLVFIGIHNSWDSVTYVALQLREDVGAPGKPGPKHHRSPSR